MKMAGCVTELRFPVRKFRNSDFLFEVLAVCTGEYARSRSLVGLIVALSPALEIHRS